MKINLLLALCIFLCSGWIILGIILIQSSNNMLSGKETNFREAKIDNFFHDVRSYKDKYGDKGIAKHNWWMGISSIIAGVGGLLLILSLF